MNNSETSNKTQTANRTARFREMERYVAELQENICSSLQEVERSQFSREPWDRPGGGGGLTRVVVAGTVFEKGGVNSALVNGQLPREAATNLDVTPGPFAACGLSLVLHPRSPRVPSIHMNVRYFELDDGDAWFGGGVDITPYYPHSDDCVHFHRVMRDACEQVWPGAYRRFKAECDDYFYLPHRGEMRGAGGIFFDYLRDNPDRDARLIRSVGDHFLESYLPIVRRRMDEPFSEEDRTFQLVRRSRYVEFNLLYDRGTAFGLKTGGRSESILMSLPPVAEFPYNYQVPRGAVHAAMADYYQPRDWLE